MPTGGYGQPTPYSQPLPAGAYPNPLLVPLPVRKRRTGLVVGIVAAIVVVLVACIWGTIATIQALHLPTTTHMTRTIYPVYSNTFQSDDFGWADDSHCFLGSDGYHIVNNYMCYAPIANEADVDIQVEVWQASGLTTYPMGIVFRLLQNQSGTHTTHYQFAITSNGQWEFLKCAEGTCDRLIGFRSSSAILTGMGTHNTLEVAAKGAHIDLFVNNTAVGSLDDSTYSVGKVGLMCGNGIECIFANFKVGEIG